MRLTFSVMFSPTLPSPRVAATTSLPAVYLRESERPSIFNSQMYSGFGMILRTRSSKSSSSSREKASARL